MFYIFSGFSLSSTLNSSRIEILTIYRKFIQNSLKIIKISELTLQRTKKLRIYSFTVISHEIDTFEPPLDRLLHSHVPNIYASFLHGGFLNGNFCDTVYTDEPPVRAYTSKCTAVALCIAPKGEAMRNPCNGSLSHEFMHVAAVARPRTGYFRPLFRT